MGKDTKLSYFISKEFSDGDGNFEEPILISISGKNIVSLTIYFDNLNNQYPKNIIVNNKLYNVNCSVITLKCDITDNVDIIIDNWNMPNSPFVIRGVI